MGSKKNHVPVSTYVPGYKYEPATVPGLDALTNKIKQAAKGKNPAEEIPQAVQEFVSSYMANIPRKKKK